MGCRPGRKLSAFALRSRQSAAVTIDEDDARGEFQDDTANDLAWARFDWSLGGRAHRTPSPRIPIPDRRLASMPHSKYLAAIQYAGRGGLRRRERDLRAHPGRSRRSVRQEISWSLGKHVVDIGAEAHWLETTLRFQIDGDRNPAAANGSSVQGGAGLPDLLSVISHSTRTGAWLQDAWQIGSRATVQAGLRLDHPGSTEGVLLSPRVAASWFLGPSRRIRGAIGRYTQSPGYEKLAQSDYLSISAATLLDPWSANRDARLTRHRAGSAGRHHGARRGLLQTFQ